MNPHSTEIAIKGTHDTVMNVIGQISEPSAAYTVLDFGAGEGALSQRLDQEGYSVKACEYAPENFRCSGIECRHCGDDLVIPYQDSSFDLVVAVELVEHVDGHLNFFREVNRVLKPGGKFLFTTPNILSLKSRVSFFFTGFFYSFGPLDPDVHDPVKQHVSAFTIDRYRFVLARSKLKIVAVMTDKYQSTSLGLFLLAPLVTLFSRLKHGSNAGVLHQNSSIALLGRKLIVISEKPST